MGKGSNNKIANSENKDPTHQTNENHSDKLKYFTRAEVNRHNQKDDCWIIINDNVYNLSNFQRIHPGGSRIINIYSGQDASEVFNAFHKELEKVNRYSKMYLIGKVQKNESSLTSLCLNEMKATENYEKDKELRDDFNQLRKIAFEKGYFKPSYVFFLLHALHVLFFHTCGYYILWNHGTSFIPLLLAILCHSISQAQSDWAQHDYGHSSLLAKPKYNRYLQMIFLGLIKGASADWWNYMHNQHHAKPNVLNVDPDVRLSPFFVLGETDPKRKAEKNAKKEEKFLYPYSLQHYYFPFVAPLLFPIYFQVMTIRYAYIRKRYLDLFTIFAMFAIHFGVTYPVFGSLLKSIGYFLVVRCIESSWFAWVSQSNHIVMDIHDDEGDRESWLSLQLRATCNLEKSWFNDWFTGHLNFQIEHHLFPTMPRHNLYKVQPLVMSLCKKHNIRYVIKPMGTAFLDILLSLKKSGQLWQETYNEFLASY